MEYQKLQSENNMEKGLEIVSSIFGNTKEKDLNKDILVVIRGDAVLRYHLGLCLAADQGNVRGQYNLACCYESGQGVKKNYKETVKLFTLVAKQGHNEAHKWLEKHKENY